jgi:spermidine/putrescine transport system substrate-binding protein
MIKWLVSFVLLFAVRTYAADTELNLLAWSEYVPQEVIDGFSKETGTKVNYEAYASNEEMMSKLLAGATAYDLIQPSEYMIEALAKKNKLAKIDWTKVPNIKNIDPALRHLPTDPKEQFSVPWMSGTVGIVVNTEKIEDEVKGYKDVFQDKYKNRIVVLNDNREIVSWALDTLGIPINDINRETLAKAKPIVADWVKLVRVYDSDSPKTALLNGDVDLGIVWSGEAAICWNQNKKFKYVLPIEGAHRFVDSLAIPANAAHLDAAHAFINYILKPEVSKLISNKFPYTNPNLEARKLLSKEQLANPASYPPGEPKLELFRDIGPAAADVDRLVTELKSGG